MTRPPILDGDDTPADYALAIHGGAGTVDSDALGDDGREAHHRALQIVLADGQRRLADGASALDVAELAVATLEDCPLFNAGHGACLTYDGQHELDAAIMDGASLECGAVAGLRRVRHPIAAARRVLEASPHVLLAGPGGDAFAADQGLMRVENCYFTTELRREQWRAMRAAHPNTPADAADSFRFGTVGAVVRDRDGRLVAATSTGGITAKRWGRIGDSPLIGAGTRADAACAISCTGAGELFIRHGVAHELSARLRLTGQSLHGATAHLLDNALAIPGGAGGLIGIDAAGRIVLGFNTRGMYRGWVSANGAQITTGLERPTRVQVL